MLSCLAKYEICSKKKRSRKCTLEYRADKWVQKRNQRKSHSNFAFLLLKKMRVGKIIYTASFHLGVIYLGKLELICKWAFSTINSTREVVNFYKKYSNIFWRYITAADVWIPRVLSVAIFILRFSVSGDFKGPLPLRQEVVFVGIFLWHRYTAIRYLVFVLCKDQLNGIVQNNYKANIFFFLLSILSTDGTSKSSAWW